MTFLYDMRAAKALSSRNYDAAIELYKKRLEADMNDPLALSMIAHCYEWKSDPETALEYAGRQLAQDPDDFYTLLLAARCWSEKNNDEQTYHYACRALEKEPRAGQGNVPRWATVMLKFLSVFKGFRSLASKAREGHLEFEEHYRESVAWARQYKEWYEARYGSRADTQ